MSAQNMQAMIMTQEEKDRFIRFNNLLEEIKDIDQSMEQLKKQIELMNDANDEGMLVDDEEGNLMISCGSIFVETDYTSMEEKITKDIEEAQNECDKLEDERSTMKAELEEIKQSLYARFGDLVVLG